MLSNKTITILTVRKYVKAVTLYFFQLLFWRITNYEQFILILKYNYLSFKNDSWIIQPGHIFDKLHFRDYH